MSRYGGIAVLLVVACGLSAVACAPDRRIQSFVPTATVPFSDADLVNPMRGQYENLLSPLFPQVNPTQRGYQAWPGTLDRSARVEWRSLQPRDPRSVPASVGDTERYDFSQIDAALAASAAQGKRLGLRITAFNSCCETDYPNQTDISVPDWLATIKGTTKSYVRDGITYVVPDWNNQDYLSRFGDLLAALGRRYDHDERLAVFEISGYGDFSENQVAFLRDQLGDPGPGPDDSIQRLGYFSQYRDQTITKESIEKLVAANLRAFPTTQIVTAPGNPEMTKQLFRDHPDLARLRKPVGIRSDGLGAYRPIPTWAENEYSQYVVDSDPIIPIVESRFEVAPVLTEWPPQLLTGGTPLEYYERGLRDVVSDHVSMTSSTGFPDQFATAPMPAQVYDIWSRANKYAGYRYAVSGVAIPARTGTDDAIEAGFEWTNFGSAPTYESWNPVYELVDTQGVVVRSTRSELRLQDLYSTEADRQPNGEPPVATTTDSVTFQNDLPVGKYTVRVRVEWAEGKPDSTTTVRFPPMQLAQFGRDSDGAYPLGAVEVEP